MATTLDTTDIPAVAVHELMVPLQLLISRGRGLALLDGLDELTLREVEDHVWDTLDGDRELKLAVVLRFRALVEVFTARRLKALFLETGFATLAPAIAAAAGLRFNARRGFNPQRFLDVLKALLAVRHEAPRPQSSTPQPMRLAA